MDQLSDKELIINHTVFCAYFCYLIESDQADDVKGLCEIGFQLENEINKRKPEIVYTHHSGDLNIDHRITHQAVFTACRPEPGAIVKKIYCFEVPSSTEWQEHRAGAPFIPNTFVDISNTLDKKLAALKAYASEMRSWPHSRSIKAVEHLAIGNADASHAWVAVVNAKGGAAGGKEQIELHPQILSPRFGLPQPVVAFRKR